MLTAAEFQNLLFAVSYKWEDHPDINVTGDFHESWKLWMNPHDLRVATTYLDPTIPKVLQVNTNVHTYAHDKLWGTLWGREVFWDPKIPSGEAHYLRVNDNGALEIVNVGFNT